MQNFRYYCSTEVIFGKETEHQTGSCIREYGGSRVLVVYGGGSVIKSGLIKRIETALKEAGLFYQLLGGVQPNPRLSFARDGVLLAKEMHADFILAVGGGSVIDTAKGIAIGAANPETDLWEYWLHKEEVSKSLPVGVVLTIAAAGSETSDSAVLTQEETGSKRGLSTPFNRPRFAIMNPELTVTLPIYQITCGIVDIMMHTMDRYFSHTPNNQMTDEIAEALLRTVIENGRIAYQNPHNYEAMSELMWCGSLSHNGLTGLGLLTDFAPHQLGHELSAMFDVAHGASLSAIWGAWASYSWQEEPARFARFAHKVWGLEGVDEKELALAGIQATVAYFESIQMPVNFAGLNLAGQSDAVLRDLAERCSFGQTRTIGSFRVLDVTDMYEIYKMANQA